MKSISEFSNHVLSSEQMKSVSGGGCWDSYYACKDQCSYRYGGSFGGSRPNQQALQECLLGCWDQGASSGCWEY